MDVFNAVRNWRNVSLYFIPLLITFDSLQPAAKYLKSFMITTGKDDAVLVQIEKDCCGSFSVTCRLRFICCTNLRSSNPGAARAMLASASFWRRALASVLQLS